MTIDSSEILASMSDLQYEPTRIQSLLLGYVERVLNGESILVDPSMPFPYLAEMNVMLTVAAIQRDEILNSRQYPEMAQIDSDLTFHMSDKDFVGMFTSPAGGWFDIYIAKDEILSNAVQVGQTLTRKLTIPRHTQVLVNNAAFTFQYPVNFIVKSYGGIDVVYDASELSPLQILSGNKVDWSIVKANVNSNSGGPIEFVRIRVYLKQMLLTSYKYSLTGSKILQKPLLLIDNFYYVRAFYMSPTGWTEMKTTNSQQVFDATDPTLLYSLVDGVLTVELPYVYYATSLVTTTVRVDVYTTKGPMTMALSGLSPSAFVATWTDLDNSDNGIYSAPLQRMSTISLFSTDIVTGGAAAPTFDVRRQRVLTNSTGIAVVPISNAQMGTTLTELGFDSSLVADNLTSRTYLATCAMPANTAGQASTGIDAAVLTMKLPVTDLVNYATVVDNGDRITIMPSTLYQYINGVLTIVPDADRVAVDLLVGDPLANKVTAGAYLSTPLTYVLDITNDEFQNRPYFLNSPSFDVTSYEASNDTLGLTISSGSTRSVVRDATGYTLQIKASSNAAWKALTDDQTWVQLGFIPDGESDYAWINGQLLLTDPADNERVYQFHIATNWDISQSHMLTTTNFSMYEAIARDYPIPLHVDLALIWGVSNYTVDGAQSTVIDKTMGTFLLPAGSVGAYQETLTTTLGDELSGLWAACRSMVGLRKYLTYPTDVIATYGQDVYAIDPVTLMAAIEVVNGVSQLVIENNKGDQVLDANGIPVLKYHAGDAILDSNGNPTMESERNVIRWWDMTLFDGVYRYATDVNDAAYMAEVPKILVEWINDTLGTVKTQLLDETKLYYQPRSTLKDVACKVEDNILVTLHTAQSLVIDYYVSPAVYGNADVRTALKATAIAQVIAGLNSTIVARNVLEAAIAANAGTDIVGVHLSGLGGMANNYNVIQLLDSSVRLCVAKAVIAQADGTYAVIDSIEVNFKLQASAA